MAQLLVPVVNILWQYFYDGADWPPHAAAGGPAKDLNNPLFKPISGNECARLCGPPIAHQGIAVGVRVALTAYSEAS